MFDHPMPPFGLNEVTQPAHTEGGVRGTPPAVSPQDRVAAQSFFRISRPCGQAYPAFTTPSETDPRTLAPNRNVLKYPLFTRKHCQH